MSFEQLPLKLVDTRLEQSGQFLRLSSVVNGKSLSFSVFDFPLLDGIRRCSNLEELVLDLKKQKQFFSLDKILKVIKQLAAEDFLSESRRWLEELSQLRVIYRWKSTLLLAELFSFRLPLRARSRKEGATAINIIYLCLLAFGILFASPIVVKGGDGAFLNFFWIFIAHSLSLSVGQLFLALGYLFKGGKWPSTSVAVSLTGIHLRVDDELSEIMANNRFIGILFVPIFGYMVLGKLLGGQVTVGMVFCWCALMISDLNPLKASLTTRFFFDLFKYNPLDWHSVRTLHWSSIFLWSICFAVAVLYWLSNLGQNLAVSIGGGFFLLSILVDVIDAADVYGRLDFLDLFTNKKQLPSLKESEAGDVKSVLKQLPLFQKLSSAQIEKIAGMSQIIEVKPGLRICQRGGTDRYLYVVLEGEAHVIVQSMLGRQLKLPLNRFSVFGEVSFFTGIPRTAEVIAGEKLKVLRIGPPDKFAKLGQDGFEFQVLSERIRILQAMSHSRLFNRLPIESMPKIISTGIVISEPSQKRILKENDESNDFYIVLEGKLRVFIRDRIVRKLESGDIFGEIAMLLGTTRTATVESETDCKLLKISHDQFWPLIAQNIRLGLAIEEVAGERKRVL